jgi:ribosomal protein S18 acetylase RimI-like enzyme
MKVNPEVKIREFSFPEDYAAVRSLWETAGPGIQLRQSDTPEEIHKKLMRDPDLFLVAELDGRMVGTVIGGFDGRRGLIYHLAVQASVREGGIGARLMDEVEKRMKEKGCIRSYLLVTKENEEAIRFYKKRGWSQMDNLLVFGKEI